MNNSPSSCLRTSVEPWYALKVRTKSELACADALNGRGYATFCPTYSQRKRYVDRWKAVTHALFPGYIFCRFDVSRKTPIISSYGIEYIVGAGAPSSIIPDVDIESISRTIAVGAVPSEYLKRGQRVRVKCGPLRGVEGTLKRVESGDRLVVSLPLLQRSASVTINADEVIPI